MDFADEHYIKFFTRDTVTWNRWPWQAQAVIGPLMRKLNKAGVADIDLRFGVAESVASLLGGGKWPTEVVRPAVDAYLADGTFELVNGKLVMPKFLEAQESRKTKQVIAHDYRQKQRDVARAKDAGLLEQVVTIRDQAGHLVTSRDPPSPAQPDPGPSLPRKPRAAKQDSLPIEEPPDPRHHPLKVKLVEIYMRKRRASGYPGFNGKHAKIVTKLLEARPTEHAPDLWPIAVAAAWERALDSQYPECSTLEDFEKKLARFMGSPSPPKGSEAPTPYAEGKVRL